MRIRHAVAAVTMIAVLAGVTPALAQGTGDDPRITRDRPTAETVKVEHDYRSWLAKREAQQASTAVSTQAAIAPYRYFSTPSHAQQNDHFCGPATVQIIDDYWGTPASQNRIAYYLRTTSAGTDFSKVDDALRFFTGRSYVYRTCTSNTDFYSAVEYGMVRRGNPIAIDVSIKGSTWDFYVFDHVGHIVPLEGFDWRWNRLRLNDPYDESYWRVGGGKTFGHKTYPRSQVAAGVMAHFRRAMVY